MPLTVCPKCNSKDILPQLPAFAETGTVTPLFAVIRQPEPANHPLVWRPGSQKTVFLASICGNCGYTELYATEPAKLLAAYRQGYR